jgi:hypothetical protein
MGDYIEKTIAQVPALRAIDKAIRFTYKEVMA